jgi:uncharacterized protein
MKILAFSDLHGDVLKAKELAQQASQENVDLVIIAGDLSNSKGKIEGIIGEFKKENLEVAIIPGNHDNMAEINFLEKKYNIKNLHGYAFKKNNVGIMSCGYSNVGPHIIDDNKLFEMLKQQHEYVKDSEKKILLTHTHPHDSILGLNFFPGSKGVKKAIEMFKPDLHICGHIHETQGIEEIIGQTKVVNVGKNGKIFEF